MIRRTSCRLQSEYTWSRFKSAGCGFHPTQSRGSVSSGAATRHSAPHWVHRQMSTHLRRFLRHPMRWRAICQSWLSMIGATSCWRRFPAHIEWMYITRASSYVIGTIESKLCIARHCVAQSLHSALGRITRLPNLPSIGRSVRHHSTAGLPHRSPSSSGPSTRRMTQHLSVGNLAIIQ